MATKKPKIVKPKLKALTIFEVVGRRFGFQVRIPPRKFFLHQGRPAVEIRETYVESIGTVNPDGAIEHPQYHAISIASTTNANGIMCSFTFCVSSNRLESKSIEDYIHKITQATLDSLVRSNFINTLSSAFSIDEKQLSKPSRIKEAAKLRQTEIAIGPLYITNRPNIF